MSNVFDKSWEPAVSVTVILFVTVSVSLSLSVSVDPWDMLNNLSFQVQAQKWGFFNYVTCHILHVSSHMSNTYVDHWDMLNKFCFHVYARKWVFIAMSHCHISHVACHISLVIWQLLILILGTCWTTFVFMAMLKSEYL